MLETKSLGTFPGLSDLGQQTLLVQPVTWTLANISMKRGIIVIEEIIVSAEEKNSIPFNL